MMKISIELTEKQVVALIIFGLFLVFSIGFLHWTAPLNMAIGFIWGIAFMNGAKD